MNRKCWILLISLSWICADMDAETIRVPDDHETIQEAIDAGTLLDCPSFRELDEAQCLLDEARLHADNKPPYPLPDNKTQSTIKSRSSKGGNADTFNELRFEDKKDEEEVYFHAERDFNRVVENDDTLKVGFEKKDKGDQTIEIFEFGIMERVLL